jgi:hypothetical protein
MAQNQQRPKGERPSKYFNFGVAWLYEETGVLNCLVNWEKNKNANKGVGYKLFLVPVDETGNPTGEGEKEITNFRIKQVERTPKMPENAPGYQIYSWE